jgi:ATP-dependent RNA circularization protein (DNA/RNA ligase family)
LFDGLIKILTYSQLIKPVWALFGLDFCLSTVSLEHFAQKWDVTKKDKYFKKRYNRLGYRRHQALIRPLVKQLSFGGYATWLEKTLVAVERKVNYYISDRYSWDTQDATLTP